VAVSESTWRRRKKSGWTRVSASLHVCLKLGMCYVLVTTYVQLSWYTFTRVVVRVVIKVKRAKSDA
jgi:hypothetical protein